MSFLQKWGNGLGRSKGSSDPKKAGIHRSSSDPSPLTNARRSQSPTFAIVQQGLHVNCTLPLASIIAELAPIPCICAVLQGLTAVFRAVENSKVNRNQWCLLKGRCVMVARIAGTQVTTFGGGDYPGLEGASQELQCAIDLIAGRASHWNQVNLFESLAHYQSISEEIKGHLLTLDACLKPFSYATEVSEMQWIDQFNIVRGRELDELARMITAVESNNQRLDHITSSQEELICRIDEMHASMTNMMYDNFQILQNRNTTPVDVYDEAMFIVQMLLTVADIRMPLRFLFGKLCIPYTYVPIRLGATSDVYSASFLLGVKVAKKVFRLGRSDREYVTRYAEMFMRDARLWSTFRCEHILPLYGVGMEAFVSDEHLQLYLMSPLMNNFDAMTYLKKYKGNPGMKEGILQIIMDAAKGLQYLHNREPPVIHSDMRGKNILVTDSGGGVLSGFGFTKILRNNREVPPFVFSVKIEGQRWMAPEMFAEDCPALCPSLDVWSWAMTALEIISGKLPYYYNKQTHTVIMDIRFGKTPQRARYPDFEKYALRPDKLWRLLERCWAMEPEDRPTINEVVIELKRILIGLDGGISSPIAPEPPAQTHVPISKTMSVTQVMDYLGQHGCHNMTKELARASRSEHPLFYGGFGEVYKFTFPDSNAVAVKITRATNNELGEDIKNAAREIHAWSKCDHPNVLKLLGLVQFNNRIGMVSPWMDYGSLRVFLSQHEEADRCEMLRDSLIFMAKVHGDLKGLNVLVSHDGIPKLADFGNATLRNCTLKFTSASTNISLTPRWAAPELFGNEDDEEVQPDQKTDVYALGMTILETITGQLPYSKLRSDNAVYRAILEGKMPKRPEYYISPQSGHGNVLWALLARCWSRSPQDRPSAEEVARTMQTITSEGLRVVACTTAEQGS